MELGNTKKIGTKVGEELLEVDRDCLNLVSLDMLRIKTKEEKSRRSFQLFLVEFKILITLMVYQMDLRRDEFVMCKKNEEGKKGKGTTEWVQIP